MNELYSKSVSAMNAQATIKELRDIRREFEKISVEKLIWSIEDLTEKPPWGNDISPSIISLGNYFVTSEGEDLILHLINALEKAIKLNCDAKIESL